VLLNTGVLLEGDPYMANKLLYLGFSTVLLTVSLLAASSVSPELRFFINTNQVLAYSRIGLAGLLMAYCLFAALRQEAVRYLFSGIGAALIIVGITGLFAPTYFGLLASYVPPIDLFVALQGGITAVLAGIELPAAPHTARGRSRLMHPPHDLLHSSTSRLTIMSSAPPAFRSRLNLHAGRRLTTEL
jgi:hypothetical protein